MGKKEEVKETLPVLGRPGNNVRIGIVGMPNVGKSTLFNDLSKLNVPAENYPFCTIDPNVARVPVPDERFDYMVKSFKPKSEVSAVLQITDIAGLVKGASEGAGLGNAFLSHIRAVDAIFQVLRCFDSKNVTHVEGTVDPVRDMEIIRDELLKKDIETIENQVEGMAKSVARGLGGKAAKEEYETLKKILETMKEGKDIRAVRWNAAEVDVINTYQLLSAKPIVYLCNLSEKNYILRKDPMMDKVREKVAAMGLGEQVIPFSARFETKLLGMSEEEAKAYCEKYHTKSQLPRIITTGYHVLNLIHFFTAGSDEVKCWTIRRGTLAPQAAGVIHTDFEKGFICAEVYKFDDFKELKTEAAIKAAGKLRQEGRNYEVQDGDVIFFKFNVGSEGKKK